MKVLVTGGYGFIGSFVVERFVREGHSVTIMDNLSKGCRENVRVNHKAYLLDVEDHNCEVIFKTGRFDVVVHLAAQINVAKSVEEPTVDTKVNILGLANMLDFAARHNVQKFIFASSAAVYGLNEYVPLEEDAVCDPVSPYGMNKLLGEYYCRKWSEWYGLSTLAFRLSNVYGPRQGLIGEGGVISIYMERTRTNQGCTVYGDGEQTRDFIYVEDVAEAIYRSAFTDLQGVMNLSTNTENSINHMIEILNGIKPVTRITYEARRAGDIKRSSLNNAKIKKCLQWIPRYTFEEGLLKTADWFLNYRTVDDLIVDYTV